MGTPRSGREISGHNSAANQPDGNPVVVITGAAGGLGAATAQLFARHGWRVLAVDLQAPDTGPNIVGLSADVTDGESMRQLGERIGELSGGRINALITFAGILGIGPLADTDPDKIAAVLDVNVMGTVRSVHALFPLLQDGRGRIVLISSETGPQHALPMNGAYAMSKHAIEAYGDALRRELLFLDLPVILIQPGPFKTGMTAAIRERFENACVADSPFAAMAAVMGKQAAGEDGKAADPQVLAEAVYRATTVPRPRSRYAVRWDLQRRILDRLPVPVVDRLLKRALGPAIERKRAHLASIAAQDT